MLLLPCAGARGGGRGGSAGGFLEAVGAAELLAEAFDAAGGVDEFLLAGEEGVAGGADVDVDLGGGAAGLEGVAAGAVDGTGLVAGVDLGFHYGRSLSDRRASGRAGRRTGRWGSLGRTSAG